MILPRKKRCGLKFTLTATPHQFQTFFIHKYKNKRKKNTMKIQLERASGGLDDSTPKKRCGLKFTFTATPHSLKTFFTHKYKKKRKKNTLKIQLKRAPGGHNHSTPQKSSAYNSRLQLHYNNK